jgi:serine/threonine protein kinase
MKAQDLSQFETSNGGAATLAQVVADVCARRTGGEIVTDTDVIAAHPQLMPQLAEELKDLLMLEQAYRAAQKAGPIEEPLPLVTPSEIDAPIRPPTDASGTPPVTLPTLPGFTPLREMTTGGQAAVYQAVQQSTGKKVAIKVLPGGPFVNAIARTRFDREADILANLDHPNIVSILDRGQTPDGSYYLVMPYIDGEALDTYSTRCRQDDPQLPRDILQVFIKAAHAVAEAHTLGIVHRDLKPSNVLVDARGEPHLLDFGLARLETALAPADWRTQTLTASGQVVGSLPWTSPEQASGRSAKVDIRSDVYSLGACLYESLTGRLPYPALGTMKEMMDHIIASPPIPFGRTKGRMVDVDAEALERVVMRALAKSPDDRHASVSAFASDLEALLAGQTVAAPPRSIAPKRWISASLGAAALLAVAGTLWHTQPWRTPALPVVVYELPSKMNTIGVTMLRVSPGPARIGTPDNAAERNDDERLHYIRITKPFWLSQFEVTRGQYRALMGGKPPAGAGEDEANLPITGLSWTDAVAFCEKLSAQGNGHYRLPTEAEWEYACRAGTSAAWSGDGEPDHMGWHGGNSNNQLHPVGKKNKNHWGFYDMHGNAAEWCQDGYNAIYPSNEADPVFREDVHEYVIRGGSFATPVRETRSGARGKALKNSGGGDVGFRIVRDVDEQFP